MKQLQEYFNQVRAMVGEFRTRNRQLFNLIVGTLCFALAIGAALYMINPGAPVVLVANLNPADRTALALRLRRHDIKFTLGTIHDCGKPARARMASSRRRPAWSGGESGRNGPMRRRRASVSAAVGRAPTRRRLPRQPSSRTAAPGATILSAASAVYDQSSMPL